MEVYKGLKDEACPKLSVDTSVYRSVAVAFVATLPGRKDVLGAVCRNAYNVGAGDSETDSAISDLPLCVSESMLNECSYDAYKSADNIDIM